MQGLSGHVCPVDTGFMVASCVEQWLEHSWLQMHMCVYVCVCVCVCARTRQCLLALNSTSLLWDLIPDAVPFWAAAFTSVT